MCLSVVICYTAFFKTKDEKEIVKLQDVPQEKGLINGHFEVTYAVGEDGRYVLEPSSGWEAKTIALHQAWEVIEAKLQETLLAVQRGERSPLAYYMVKNQMDIKLLAEYSGISRWRVRLHLMPAVFTRLRSKTLSRYSSLFDISVEELQRVPESPALPQEYLEYKQKVDREN